MEGDAGRSRFQANHGHWFSGRPFKEPRMPRLTSAAGLANLAASSALSAPMDRAARFQASILNRRWIMQNAFCRRTRLALLCVALTTGPGAAFAQSGSAGGSIGNDEKSLSGTRSAEPERPARRSKPAAEEPRRSAPRRSGGVGGGGGGNFDGAWV